MRIYVLRVSEGRSTTSRTIGPYRRESYGPSSVMTHNVLTSKVVGLGAQPKGNQTISCPVSSQTTIVWVTTM